MFSIRKKRSRRPLRVRVNRKFPLGAAALICVLALIITGIVLFPKAEEEYLHFMYPRDYEDIVIEQAAEFDLPEELVFAVIKAESSFEPNAQSHAGAKGLMQLTDDSFKWMQQILGEEYSDIFDPETNIRCGCAMLRHLTDYFGDERLAICAYNAGIGNVDEWLNRGLKIKNGKDIPFPETENYLKRVLEYREKYEEIY